MSATHSRNSNAGFEGDMSGAIDGQNMSMDPGDQLEAGIDPLANVSERKKLNTGSLVLVVVVLLAAVGLWSMRAMTKVGAMTGRTSDVEANIEKFLSSLKTEKAATSKGGTSPALAPSDTVLSVLTETYTQRQVPLTDVQRNPFIWPGDGVQAPVAIDDPSKGLAKRQADRKAKIEHASNSLQLKSVIMSKVPIANISGRIVRPNDEISADSDNVTFRVVAIAADSITLVCDDAELDLSVAITLETKR